MNSLKKYKKPYVITVLVTGICIRNVFLSWMLSTLKNYEFYWLWCVSGDLQQYLQNFTNETDLNWQLKCCCGQMMILFAEDFTRVIRSKNYVLWNKEQICFKKKKKKGKVYFRSKILECPSIGQYWNISGVPVLPENVIFMFFRTCWCYSEAYNTGMQKWSSIVQYSCTSIWDLKYTFSKKRKLLVLVTIWMANLLYITREWW